MTSGISQRFCIEGQTFCTINELFAIALLKGAPSHTTVARRLKAGASTWAEICSPVSRSASAKTKAATAAWKRKKKESRDECAAMLAAIDARRREMGL